MIRDFFGQSLRLGWVGLPPQSRVTDFLSVADIPEDKTEIGAESNVFRDYN